MVRARVASRDGDVVDAQRRQPIRKLELLSADGRRLAPEDVATLGG